nr:hypothetical protein [Tanacetum cinerariifolium]
SDSAVSYVFHQDVASKKHNYPGEGSGFIYAESQDKYSISQLLQLASNEKTRLVVDYTQLEKGLVKMVDMMLMEEKISDNKLDEKMDVGVIVIPAMLQASPHLNAREVHEPHLDDKVDAEVCVDVHIDHVDNRDESILRDSVGEVLVEVVELEQNLIYLFGDIADEQMQVDSNNHSDVYVEDQNSPYQDMDNDSNNHFDVQVKHKCSQNMDKENVLVEFDGIKATTSFIDKRK